MKFRYFLLTLATALPLLAAAQTPLGQPSLDESKVQIWCATIRYVYDDAGHPALKSTVQCDGTDLAPLAASIRPDSLRVYSVLYAPIEEKGNIYTGKKDNPARLEALVTAIIKKLKSSPARRRDPARMQRLEALEKALTDYATHGTPPGDVAAAMLPEAPDTTKAAGNAAPGPAEAAETQGTENLTSNPQASNSGHPAPGSAQDLLTRFAAPLALILSILALVIFAVQRISMARWSRQQRRETLAARQAAAASQAAVAATQTTVADTAARLQRAEALVRAAHETPGTAAASPAPAPENLTDGQRREVERLVSQRVDEELKWLRENLPEMVATAVASQRESATNE